MKNNLWMVDFLGVPWANLKVKGSEDSISIAIANYFRELSLEGKAQFIWFHVPNENGNNKQFAFGAKLRAMGKMPGCADFVLMGKDKSVCLEVKTSTGRQGPNQKLFQQWCNDNGVYYRIVKSVDETKEVLKEIGL